MPIWVIDGRRFCLLCEEQMIVKAKIRIESIIENLDSAGLPDGEAEKSVSEADGIYRFDDGNAFISFSEEDGGKRRTEISLIGGAVTVRRSGAIESEMYFCEGESHASLYGIPPYQFDVTVNTRRVRVEIDNRGGKIDLFYNMNIGGADKSARMKIWIS